MTEKTELNSIATATAMYSWAKGSRECPTTEALVAEGYLRRELGGPLGNPVSDRT